MDDEVEPTVNECFRFLHASRGREYVVTGECVPSRDLEATGRLAHKCIWNGYLAVLKKELQCRGMQNRDVLWLFMIDLTGGLGYAEAVVSDPLGLWLSAPVAVPDQLVASITPGDGTAETHIFD